MTPDIAAARSAATEVCEHRRFTFDTSNGIMEEADIASKALLWLTDPTPLTWEIVCEHPGYRLIGDDHFEVGELACSVQHDGRLHFWVRKTGEDCYPQPRTLGELRQLMLRTNPS